MPLGTLDRTPPPFFRQGLPARTKLVLFSALAVFLMAADGRVGLIQPLRAAAATALLPAVRVLSVPVQAWHGGGEYLAGLQAALSSRDAMRAMLAQQAERSARADQLAQENARLRALLELRPAVTVKSLAAEVLYEAPDPFSYKLFLDRGQQHGVVAGAPVINEAGVLGQVTRVYPFSAEVTLLVDKEAAIPVVNTRTQHRSAAFGSGDGHAMELRFVGGNDDVQAGDLLTTSGTDGVYPPGLPVAKVAVVDRRADSAFARISLAPTAQPDGVRHVLVLEPLSVQLPARPETPTEAETPRGRKGGKR
ncbi:rod shape-determining protein MreC [Ideonella sp. DXS29W]|uniref:Cell shape-determining protein MreC n=1 Tax=Ideonella lacteola TaxID=2984193 RepID=A0ABU9BM64_9BURK